MLPLSLWQQYRHNFSVSPCASGVVKKRPNFYLIFQFCDLNPLVFYVLHYWKRFLVLLA